MTENLILSPPGYRDIGLRYWWLAESGKFSRVGSSLADRHYSRRKPGSPQFMPPGQTIVLIGKDLGAVFGWWRPHPNSGLKAMNGLDGWTCTIFRRESGQLASDLILDAELAVAALGHDCGESGFITYVFDSKIKSRNPGFCFKAAGYRVTGRSADDRKTLLQKPFSMAGCVDCEYCETTGEAYDPQTGKGPTCPACSGTGARRVFEAAP